MVDAFTKDSAQQVDSTMAFTVCEDKVTFSERSYAQVHWIYEALKTTLKVSLNNYLNPANFGQIMTINKGNLFVFFYVGPSVKLG